MFNIRRHRQALRWTWCIDRSLISLFNFNFKSDTRSQLLNWICCILHQISCLCYKPTQHRDACVILFIHRWLWICEETLSSLIVYWLYTCIRCVYTIVLCKSALSHTWRRILVDWKQFVSRLYIYKVLSFVVKVHGCVPIRSHWANWCRQFFYLSFFVNGNLQRICAWVVSTQFVRKPKGEMGQQWIFDLFWLFSGGGGITNLGGWEVPEGAESKPPNPRQIEHCEWLMKLLH